MELSGKKITVIGLGESGLAASRLLLAQGAKVSVSDSRKTPSLERSAGALRRSGALVELGGHSQALIEGREMIVTSPGVPPGSDPLRWAEEGGIPIRSEIELGYFFCKGKIIAVTGSNGKSTTVSLIGHLLEKGGKKAFVCGNIGKAFCGVAPRVAQGDWVALEVSSFQLEYCRTFRPAVAIILNVAPNHLDRHPSFESYLLAKRRIARAQTENDFLLLNADDPFTKMLGEDLPVRRYFFSRLKPVEGVFLRQKEVFVSLGGKEECLATLEGLRILGPHNEENALSALLAAYLAGVDRGAIQEGLRTFQGLPHRMEPVGEYGGIRFVNDSKSTTVSSTLRALETLPEPLFLIAGGREKNEDFQTFAKSPLLKKVERIILIGEAKEKIVAAVSGRVPTLPTATLEEAVRIATRSARPGATVVLSPMCTSFDMFQNFEERGECFKKSVASLFKIHAH